MPPEPAPAAPRAGRAPTIFAMGGGGFTMEPDNPALDDYVRTLAPAREPRICLLPTAGGDSEDQIRRFHAAFGDQLCEPTHISLFRLGQQPVPLREHLLAQDIIYVGGGSMVNLLALWRAHGLDEILREAWQAGIVLAGLSAGSMCWFEWGVTRSVGRADAARAGSASFPARTPSTTTASPSGGRSTSRPWQRRDPAGLGASTTAPGCSSAARGWRRWSRRGRARARTGCARSTARPSRRRSSRGCSRRPRTRTDGAARRGGAAGAARRAARPAAGLTPRVRAGDRRRGCRVD